MRQFVIASRQRQRDNLIEHQGQEKNINKYFKALCLNEVATPNVYFSGPQWHQFRVEGGGGGARPGVWSGGVLAGQLSTLACHSFAMLD